MDNLNTLIRNKRKSLGITQTELAGRLNIDRKTYANWESGNLSVKQLVNVCNILGLKIQVIDALSALN